MGREDLGVGIEVRPLPGLLTRIVTLEKGNYVTSRSGKKYLVADRTHGGGSQLVALHHPVEGLSLLPLSGRGPLRTRHAAQTETLEVLVRHGLDDGLAEGNHVGPEVRGPAIPLVTIEPGKETIKTKE